MRWLAIGTAGLLGIVVLLVALIVVASETGGEVVVLRTLDDLGEPHETRLWIVEQEGALWLRSGQASSGWFQRLAARPEVELTRAGVTAEYLARPVRDPAVRERIHDRMAEKYGFAESLIAATRDGSESIPVRLDPVQP